MYIVYALFFCFKPLTISQTREKNIHAERNDRYDADIEDTRIYYIPSKPLAYMGKTENKKKFIPFYVAIGDI